MNPLKPVYGLAIANFLLLIMKDRVIDKKTELNLTS